jgi:copper chaperone CopZ
MQKALAQVDGVVSVEPNMANQTLSVTYDSKKLNVKNIEYALVREGFDVNDNKGNEQARQKLPADCR